MFDDIKLLIDSDGQRELSGHIKGMVLTWLRNENLFHMHAKLCQLLDKKQIGRAANSEIWDAIFKKVMTNKNYIQDWNDHSKSIDILLISIANQSDG